MKSFTVEKPKLSGELQPVVIFEGKPEFEEASFAGISAESLDLSRLSVMDSALDTCNLSAAKIIQSFWRRVKITNTRMSGVIWYDSIIRDVEFTDCKLDLANFRATKFRNVVFRDCVLSGSDWQGAELTNVIFESCDVNDMDVNGCVMKNVDLRSSTFITIKGARNLAGTTMSRQQLIMLAPIFANELGIKIED